MTSKERDFLKEKIQDELSSLETNIYELKKSCEAIAPECALGDLTRFELIHDQEVSQKALKYALKRQTKLLYALSKIQYTDFGLCIECDESIDFQRLLLLPESTHCMNCLKK
ncbi:MAG TPA: transcriptional regulator [Sulfurimonas sp.]|nr:transcriptional regulator [Sulfurimonas sp.]